MIYISSIFAKKDTFGFGSVYQSDNKNTTHLIIPKERSALMISSKATRCAIFACASFHRSGRRSTKHTTEYLWQYYKYMREAMSSNVTVDFIYTCFVMFLLSSTTLESFDTIWNHFFGLFEIIKYL